MKPRTLQALCAALFMALTTPTMASASEMQATTGNVASTHGGSRVAAQIQPWEQFRIRLVGMQCDDEQDGIPFGSDETYVLIGIIKGAANGNAPTFAFLHTDVYEGIDAGEAVHPNLDVMLDNVQGSVVIVTQVVESDGDALAVVMDAMADSNAAFAAARAGGIVDPLALGGAVGNAFYNSALATSDDPIEGPVRILLTIERFDNLGLGASSMAIAQARGGGGEYLAAYQLLRTR